MKGRNARKSGGMVYAGGDSNVVKEAKGGNDGFKKGGKAMGKVHGEAAKMNAGRKPRKSGGGVFSSAASGSPRKGSSHY